MTAGMCDIAGAFDAEDARLEASYARQNSMRRSLPAEHPLHAEPRFDRAMCSQCGGVFGPADHGYSHCINHSGRMRLGWADETATEDHQ